MLPRGFRARIEGETLRFFTYWRQATQRTDFDLSMVLLDDNIGLPDLPAARTAYRSALDLATTDAEHRFLDRRLAEL